MYEYILREFADECSSVSKGNIKVWAFLKKLFILQAHCYVLANKPVRIRINRIAHGSLSTR
jgi:hypothetical protein